MAFATEDQRQEATAQLIALKKPKAIAEALGVSISDIYTLNFQLKKAGKIPGKKPAKDASPKKTAKKSKAVPKQLDEFGRAVYAEKQRAESEIDRLNKLQAAYDATHPDFAESLDKKIQAEQKRLSLLDEYLSGK